MNTTKHTPGPLSYNQKPVAHRYNIEDAGGYIIYSAYKEEDAARIVACVNACEGINPDAIPELLAHVRNLVELGGKVEAHDVASARAALAKAEGK